MAKARPLSPHLQIYRLPLPAILSITHRMTGVILSTGTLLLAGWLVALANGPESFAIAMMIIGHPLGQLVMFAYSAALFYHMCNEQCCLTVLFRDYVWISDILFGMGIHQ